MTTNKTLYAELSTIQRIKQSLLENSMFGKFYLWFKNKPKNLCEGCGGKNQGFGDFEGKMLCTRCLVKCLEGKNGK